MTDPILLTVQGWGKAGPTIQAIHNTMRHQEVALERPFLAVYHEKTVDIHCMLFVAWH